MRVFVSWSGDVSHQVAIALKEWLPNVLQALDCFVSSVDIAKGSRWPEEVASELDASKFGLVCVTPDNVASPWLNFEAGALSKSVDAPAFVVPFLHGLQKSDVKPPLGHFQAVSGEFADVVLLLRSLNAAAGSPLQDSRLEKAAEVWWPNLRDTLSGIEVKDQDAQSVRRSDREILEEVLATVRGAAREISAGITVAGVSTSGTRRWLDDDYLPNLRQRRHRTVEELDALIRPIDPDVDLRLTGNSIYISTTSPLPPGLEAAVTSIADECGLRARFGGPGRSPTQPEPGGGSATTSAAHQG